jgi:hypothetical protein
MLEKNDLLPFGSRAADCNWMLNTNETKIYIWDYAIGKAYALLVEVVKD